MLGERYNEKVDVYSCVLCHFPFLTFSTPLTEMLRRFAMCMVEVVSCQLPWTGVALGATHLPRTV